MIDALYSHLYERFVVFTTHETIERISFFGNSLEELDYYNTIRNYNNHVTSKRSTNVRDVRVRVSVEFPASSSRFEPALQIYQCNLRICET